jgi:hypothetical protein
MLLQLVVVLQPLEKWVVDFIGPINLLARHLGSQYIINAIDYLTRWDEVETIRDCSMTTGRKFIFENIITRFGCP